MLTNLEAAEPEEESAEEELGEIFESIPGDLQNYLIQYQNTSKKIGTQLFMPSLSQHQKSFILRSAVSMYSNASQSCAKERDGPMRD